MTKPFYSGSVIIIRIYAVGNHHKLIPLTNASFSMWAWVPTPNGTAFMPICVGTGSQTVMDASTSVLVSWAEGWVRTYGNVAITSLEPSITIWVSYYIPLPNGSIELLTEPFFQPMNLSLPLSNKGTETMDLVMGHPFRTILNPNVISSP